MFIALDTANNSQLLLGAKPLGSFNPREFYKYFAPNGAKSGEPFRTSGGGAGNDPPMIPLILPSSWNFAL